MKYFNSLETFSTKRANRNKFKFVAGFTFFHSTILPFCFYSVLPSFLTFALFPILIPFLCLTPLTLIDQLNMHIIFCVRCPRTAQYLLVPGTTYFRNCSQWNNSQLFHICQIQLALFITHKFLRTTKRKFVQFTQFHYGFFNGGTLTRETPNGDEN